MLLLEWSAPVFYKNVDHSMHVHSYQITKRSIQCLRPYVDATLDPTLAWNLLPVWINQRWCTMILYPNTPYNWVLQAQDFKSIDHLTSCFITAKSSIRLITVLKAAVICLFFISLPIRDLFHCFDTRWQM